MNVQASPNSTIDAVLAELVEEFDFLRSTADELGVPARDFIDEHIYDLGRSLPKLPEADKIPENKVSGCLSQVWLVASKQGSVLHFRADSDSLFVRGNIALLVKLFSGRTPSEILDFNARAALDRLGMPSSLTPGRANGLNAMVGRIREAALAVA